MMKTPQHFLASRSRPDRVMIRDEWIEFVLTNAARSDVKADGQMRRWSAIEDAEGRTLLS